ncbi:MAG: alpha/beta hydrolase, partial [Myxococcota bacterium]|nr:alpha/beta hydrolase [Myxococcota bacterium]
PRMLLPTYIDGEGPTVVMVHGRGEAHETWDPLLPFLDRYTALRVDLPGFGAAPAPKDPERYSIASNREDLAETTAHLDAGFALVGHSMGGMVAANYAAYHPERLGALVLECTAAAYPYSDDYHPEQRDFLNHVAALAQAEGMEGVCAHLAERYGLDAAGQAKLMCLPAHSFAATIQVNATMEDLHPRLASLQVPTLVVAGRKDAIFVPWCQRLADTIPHAELLVVDDVGHGPHGEAPEVFAAALHTFLERHLR